ncbi:MAG: hypothetical protein C0631_16410 [Sedimenticola sp.]|jgi:hypothetical protein|nr:MAG: hypothetical protein C0631_16410 [Sedimenticola sp.]
MRTKQLVVLGRRDHAEAMRVAAGLTIAGHGVRLIFMNGPVAETAENAEQAELLELCEIEPETTVQEEDLPYLDSAGLTMALLQADSIVNL